MRIRTQLNINPTRPPEMPLSTRPTSSREDLNSPPPLTQDTDQNTNLINAALNGDLDQIKTLLIKGAKINHVESNGFTTLMFAALNGREDCVKLLLDKNANVDLASKDGFTALILAAQNGHKECVETLLANGASVDLASKDGFTALMFAAKNEHTEIIKILLEAGATLTKDQLNNMTNSSKDICELLKTIFFLKNILPPTRNQHFRCQKFWSMFNNGLEKLAKLTNKISLKLDPYKVFLEIDDFFILTLFNIHKKYAEACDSFNSLLKIGLDPNQARSSDGATPLMIAAQNGFTDIAQFLLARKDINLNQKLTSNDATPLFIAAQNGHIEIVKVLLDQGAEVNIKYENSHSPLIVAVMNGYEHIVKTLLDNGANVNLANQGDETPLCLVAQRGHLNCVNLLLAGKASVDHLTAENNTALIIASQYGYKDCVKAILAKKPDVNHINNKEKLSALMFAAVKGYTEIVKVLLAGEARVDLENSAGWAALTLAEEFKHKDCVELLLDATVNAFKTWDSIQLNHFNFPPKGPTLDEFLKEAFDALEDSQTAHINFLLKQGYDIPKAESDDKSSKKQTSKRKKGQQRKRPSASASEELSDKQKLLQDCQTLFTKMDNNKPLSQEDIDFFKTHMSLKTRYSGKPFSDYLTNENLTVALIAALDPTDIEDADPKTKEFIENLKAKYENSATQIQKIGRGEVARSNFKLQKNSAKKIQKINSKNKITKEQQELNELRLKDRARKAYKSEINNKKASKKVENNVLKKELKQEEDLSKEQESKTNSLQEALSLEKAKTETIEHSLTCPITHSIMTDPVTTADGQTYERAAIDAWFARGNNTAPLSGAQLEHTNLTPNIVARQLCQSFRAHTESE